MQNLSMLLDREPGALSALRKAEVGQRGHYYVEGGILFAITTAAALGERRDELGALVKAAGPAVDEEQRQGIRGAALLVEEVHGERLEPFGLQLGGELWELVELRLGAPPVEGLGPVLGQALHLGERRAALPLDAPQLIGVPGPGQPVLEVRQLLVRDGDLERLYLVGRHLGVVAQWQNAGGKAKLIMQM